MTHILSIDVGTSAVKAALVTPEGTISCTASKAVHSSSQSEGVVEQSPREWWEATKQCILECLGTDVPAAIVLTGQMQDVIIVKGQEPIRPAILYSDCRAEAQSRKLNAACKREDNFWASSSSVPAKIAWLQEHEPEAILDADFILFGAAGFVCLQLCGLPACDFTTASTTGLLAEEGSDWSADALDILGLPKKKLPTLYPGSAKVGAILKPVAESIGLPTSLPVFHGCGDAGATTVGSGCSKTGGDGGIYAYIGTTGWVAKTSTVEACCSGSMRIRSPERDGTFIHIAPCSNAGGNVEEVLLRSFHAHRSREEGFAAAEALAAQSPAGAGGLLYLPYLHGERCPFSDPHARASFVGIHSNTSAADMHRAVLEGVAFALCCLLEAVEGGRGELELEGPGPRRLRVVGGGTKSGVLMQAIADVSGYTVAVLEQGDMVAVRGAAALAAVGLGWVGEGAPLPEGFFPVRTEYFPQAATAEMYEQLLEVFRSLYPALKEAFGRLAGVREAMARR